MKTINNELIRSFSPCYDPSKYVTDENETLSVLEWVSKYRGTVPDEDIIWLLCHEEFLSDKDLRLFAVWCAREALKLVENPDIRSVNACNVAERYANGEATDEELEDAYADADYPAADAAFPAAYYAACAAYYAAAYVASYAAVHAASYATTAATAVTAYTVACYAANGDTTINASQLNKLLTYFK